jgi:ferredoxin
MEGRNGPLKGKAVKLDIVIAGDRASEVDYAGCWAIGCAPSTVEHLVAIENATGEKFNNSSIKGHTGAFPIRQLELPPVGGWHGPLNLSQLFKLLFKKKPALQYEDKCTLCGDCIKVCPAGCVEKNDSKIVIDRGKCVECLCCAEVCSFGAMVYTVRLGWVHTTLQKTYQTMKKIRVR